MVLKTLRVSKPDSCFMGSFLSAAQDAEVEVPRRCICDGVFGNPVMVLVQLLMMMMVMITVASGDEEDKDEEQYQG